MKYYGSDFRKLLCTMLKLNGCRFPTEDASRLRTPPNLGKHMLQANPDNKLANFGKNFALKKLSPQRIMGPRYSNVLQQILI